MKKTICDRCGIEMSDVVYAEIKNKYPHYHIVEMKSISNLNPLDGTLIDLCPSCEKEFYNWLHNKED